MNTIIGALKSKTVWFNVLGIIATVFASDQIKQYISIEHLAEIQAGINLILRYLTTSSLASKGA